MTLREFIREHREELDAAILATPGMQGYRLNDDDRADWIRNDEGLYNWARRELGRNP